MKKVKVKIKFTDDDEVLCGAGKKILAALKKAKVKVTKFRYTYVESKNGLAEMPPALILASFLCDFRDFNGFCHILPKLSGEYEFIFEK